MNRSFIRDACISFVLTFAFFSSSIPEYTLAALSCSVSTTCTSPNVVVYRMASTSNSHAELPSNSNYSQLVCCGGVSSLSNTCTGSYGTALLLQQSTNSHVQQNTFGVYTNKACVSLPSGSVTIGYQSGSCTGYDTTLGSMASTSNSHVGDANAYTTKICGSAVSNSLTFLTDGSSETLPALSPGVTVASTTILYASTGNTTGFNVTAQRSNATATLLLSTDSTVTIPDKTGWSAPAATTTAGGSTASTTQPQTLQFRIRLTGTDAPNYAKTWWGNDDTTANALFAGFPTTAQAIVNRSTSSLSTTTAYVLYNVNAPGTQKTGSYTGGVVYSATANP